MFPDIKYPAYRNDDHQSQQKETHKAITSLLPWFFCLVLTDAWRFHTVTAQKPPLSRLILESW